MRSHSRIGILQKVSARSALAATLSLLATAIALGEGLPKLEVEVGAGKLRLYGQIDTGVLYYDDGYENNTYAPVGNSNSSSRFGVTYDQKIEDVAFQARFEAEYKPFSSSNININNDEPNWDFNRTNIRKLEVSFATDAYGVLYVGQGSMASDGTAEMDLSGTKVIAYSLVSDTAGGQILRNELNAASFGPAIKSAFANYDGLSRKLRIRYDTPKFAGVRLAASVGNDEVVNRDGTLFWDVAATYDSDKSLGDFRVQAGLAAGFQENDITTVDGSASVLHSPTGLNFTIAGGSRDNGNRTAQYAYAKLGLLRDYVDWGSTALAVDYYVGDEIAAAGTDSHSVGFAAVQTVKDWNLELWLTYRRYMYDSRTANFRDGNAIFGGTRLTF